MPVPSAQLGLPQIAGTDSPDIPRDLNAIIARFEALQNTFATRAVLEVGQVGQIRAGRPLTVADFTSQGLSVPLLLANLSVLAGAGSNLGSGGNLTNKGAVVNAPGIMGAAAEAAQFAGATGQALYIPDIGAGDPFRIRTGSFGCWSRTAKRGVGQELISKATPVVATRGFELWVSSTNVLSVAVTVDTAGTYISLLGFSDVADDRLHFCVFTVDGTRVRLYVDGALEAQAVTAGPMNTNSSGPLNIGAAYADAAVAATLPHYGRLDEVFVTADVLSEEQVRNLYCASLTHTLGVVPNRVRLAVRRRRRGGITPEAFPSTPVRLHRFDAGSLADTGSGGVPLVANPGTGAIVSVAGVDGSAGGAYSFSGAHTGLSASDAGLPAALTSRSYGIWFKATSVNSTLIAWGTMNTGDARINIASTGAIATSSAADSVLGPMTNDGLPHFAVVVEDNAAADGVKRKLYLDSRLVAGSTVMNSLTLAGANRFRVGAAPDGTAPLTGQVDDPFVYAGALTGDQVRALYNLGSQQLAPSPKAEGDHIEAMTATNLLALFDSLEGTDLIDLVVAA